MAEPQTQKKSKKQRKKSDASAGQPNVLTDKDTENPISSSLNSDKQSVSQELGIKNSGNITVASTADCKNETVEESAGKKKKKSKKKSKEVLKETFPENNNSESLLNFSENGIQLLNHPEISVTLTDSNESKDNEIKSVEEKNPPAQEEKNEVENTTAAAATASKKNKKKKKKKNNDNPPVAATTSSETTTFATPSYTKVVTADNTCVLVVNNEFSIDAKSKENSEIKRNKVPDNNIGFSIGPEKQLGNVLLTKNFSPDTNIQFSNSVSIFPVLTNSSTPETPTTVNLSLNSEANANVSVSAVNEDPKENLEESKLTKSQLKAERRAKQEAQRAAKALAKGTSKCDNTSTTNESKNVSPKEKSLPKEKAQPKECDSKTNEVVVEKIPVKSSVEKESHHRVKLFCHLPQCKQFDIDAKIHPAILEIGLQYNKGIICGSNARCIALLDALKEVIKDFTLKPDKNFCRDLESSIQRYLSFLNNCRPLSVSMLNAVKFLKHEINHMPSDMEITDIKERLYDFIDKFVKEDILIAKEAICNCASSTVVDGDVILMFGFSSLIRDILCKAHDKKKIFRVVVVDSRPKLEGLKMLRCLVKHGLHCSYISINAVSYIMKEVSKVMFGVHALLSNGYVLSRLGTKQIALVAWTCDVPVFICCESYKLCERVLTDCFVQNELGEPEDIITTSLVSNDSLKNWRDLPSLQPLNLLYDVTPSDLIFKIITEKGPLACTSIPVMCRVKYGALSQ